MTMLEFTKLELGGDTPPPRSWHVSINLGLPGRRCVLVHGGYDGEEALKDAYVLDMDANKWIDVSAAFPSKARAGEQSIPNTRRSYPSLSPLFLSEGICQACSAAAVLTRVRFSIPSYRRACRCPLGRWHVGSALGRREQRGCLLQRHGVRSGRRYLGRGDMTFFVPKVPALLVLALFRLPNTHFKTLAKTALQGSPQGY